MDTLFDYLLTIDEFTIGKVITVNVFDSDKNWSIEVLTLGRETVKTPVGEFAADQGQDPSVVRRGLPEQEGGFYLAYG